MKVKTEIAFASHDHHFFYEYFSNNIRIFYVHKLEDC